MKFTKLAFVTFLAVASVEAVAHPYPEAISEAAVSCNIPGQPCYKAKRFAEAPVEPVASERPDAEDCPWCWLPGEAKRQPKEVEAAYMRL